MQSAFSPSCPGRAAATVGVHTVWYNAVMAPADQEGGPGGFPTTRWSVVLAAGRAESQDSAEALDRLCQTYWYPLYAFVRRRGHNAEDARDLTQGFFTRLLDKHDLERVDQARGRFRSFLLASFTNYLRNQYDHKHAQKRGGGRTILSLDLGDAENRYGREPADTDTPERLFERRWALTLLNHVLDQLQAECARKGRAALFDKLKAHLHGGTDNPPLREVAADLGMTEEAVRVAVHRLRRRCRDLLRDAVAQTLQDPAEVDDEIRHLFAALDAT